jgi:hypothetical protein
MTLKARESTLSTPATGKFVNYRHKLHNINSLANDGTGGLVIDKMGNIWIAMMDNQAIVIKFVKTFIL